MRTRKGFVFSLIAVSFMILLIMLATKMENEYLENERVVMAPLPNTYASASIDNIGTLAAEMLLPSASINQSDSATVVWVSDTLPRDFDPDKIFVLKTVAEGPLASSQHAVISVNTTRVQNGSLDLRIMDDFNLQSTMNGSPVMIFRRIGNASTTNATQYNVTINVNDYRNNDPYFGSNYNGTGAVNVTVIYTDLNGTGKTSGLLNPHSENHMTITYLTGKVDIVIGRVSQDGFYYDDALWMNSSNENTAYSFSAQLPAKPMNVSTVMVFPVEITYIENEVQKTANASR